MAIEAAAASEVETVQRFAEAYAAVDYDRLRELLHPDVHERELAPGGLVELHGADAVVAELRDFVAAHGGWDLLELAVVRVGDRPRATTRCRTGDGGVIEWHVFCTVRDGRIAALDAVCSGTRPLDG